MNKIKRLFSKLGFKLNLPLLLAFLSIQTFSASNVERVFLFDSQDNNLFYVDFHYSNGKNTGRTVFNKEGYALYYTNYEEKGGKRTKEKNFNEMGELKNYATHSFDGNKKTVGIFNEFNRPLFQASYNTEPLDNSYQIKNLTGVVTHNLKYEYKDTLLSRINIYDNAGKLTHYVLVQNEGQLSAHAPPELNRQYISFKSLPATGKIQIFFLLETTQHVKAYLFNTNGSRMPPVLNEVLKRGAHTVTLDINQYSVNKGVYFLRFSLGNGKKIYTKKILKF